MKRLYRNLLLVPCAVLVTGCSGPSTRVLPRAANEYPYQIPEEEVPLLEEVNPFYIQEAMQYLCRTSRVAGSEEEKEAVQYMARLLENYGYEVETQQFALEKMKHDMEAEPPAGQEPQSPLAIPEQEPPGDPQSFVWPGSQAAGQTGINLIALRKAPSPSADILLICAHHDTVKDSPGADSSATGAVTLLETARLLSRFPTDTEIRFVSFSANEIGNQGCRFYLDTLPEEDLRRIIGAVVLDELGNAADASIVLMSAAGNPVMVGDLLQTAAREFLGVIWHYQIDGRGDGQAFVQHQIPAVRLTRQWHAYEYQLPQDRAEVIDAEQLARTVDVLTQTVAGIMETETPSLLAKSRSVNPLQNQAYIQRPDTILPFGQGYQATKWQLGLTGSPVSSVADDAGVVVAVYQYLMEWFDVQQVIPTNYYYTDDKLTAITLMADRVGVDFEDMKERLSAVYGEPADEEPGPYGVQYNWVDLVYRKKLSLIPARDGFQVDIQEYIPEWAELARYPIARKTPDEPETDDPGDVKLLALVRTVIPASVQEKITGICFYTDGVGAGQGYLQPVGTAENPEALAELWLMLDSADAIREDHSWRDYSATVVLLTECLGQLIEYSQPDPYPAAFWEAFHQQPDELNFAQSFRLFVLCQKPERVIHESDNRILFFYNYEELMALRAEVRKNLQLERN